MTEAPGSRFLLSRFGLAMVTPGTLWPSLGSATSCYAKVCFQHCCVGSPRSPNGRNPVIDVICLLKKMNQRVKSPRKKTKGQSRKWLPMAMEKAPGVVLAGLVLCQTFQSGLRTHLRSDCWIADAPPRGSTGGNETLRFAKADGWTS